jgi:hypothetical protein
MKRFIVLIFILTFLFGCNYPKLEEERYCQSGKSDKKMSLSQAISITKENKNCNAFKISNEKDHYCDGHGLYWHIVLDDSKGAWCRKTCLIDLEKETSRFDNICGGVVPAPEVFNR